jgi:hypothetical protein
MTETSNHTPIPQNTSHWDKLSGGNIAVLRKDAPPNLEFISTVELIAATPNGRDDKSDPNYNIELENHQF